ncbi:hypothetical protein A7D01_05305 [Xanthomonas arboricola]|nr:hypothetical protein A7D01_05305 [Xanthomonas arboricola]
MRPRADRTRGHLGIEMPFCRYAGLLERHVVGQRLTHAMHRIVLGLQQEGRRRPCSDGAVWPQRQMRRIACGAVVVVRPQMSRIDGDGNDTP